MNNWVLKALVVGSLSAAVLGGCTFIVMLLTYNPGFNLRFRNETDVEVVVDSASQANGARLRYEELYPGSSVGRVKPGRERFEGSFFYRLRGHRNVWLVLAPRPVGAPHGSGAHTRVSPERLEAVERSGKPIRIVRAPSGEIVLKLP
jgi:hypothetical protein